ncbi:MAG TPA: sulfatase-like hydrolase/transferase, partial [bacterium]
MNRRRFLAFSACGAGALASGKAFSAVPSFLKSKKRRPNILLIMTDDMGFSDIGCYGGEIRTPNLDRLAQSGLRFTQFYNAARCCPSRASLLTGLYPHQAGMGDMVRTDDQSGPYQGYLNERCVTIAELLGRAGYATLMSGKWHVGERRPNWPTDRGFEKYFGLISGAANYFDIERDRTGRARRQMALDDKPYHPPKQGFYMTEAVTDRAVDFLGSHGSGERPFFLYVAYTAPHWPLHALPEDIKKYMGQYDRGWDVLRGERYGRQLEMGVIDGRWEISPRDDEVTPWQDVRDKKGMAAKMEVYAAQIDCMDRGIGRILKKLGSLGKVENTLILFLSDNGGCHEDGPWGFDDRNNGLP